MNDLHALHSAEHASLQTLSYESPREQPRWYVIVALLPLILACIEAFWLLFIGFGILWNMATRDPATMLRRHQIAKGFAIAPMIFGIACVLVMQFGLGIRNRVPLVLGWIGGLFCAAWIWHLWNLPSEPY